ncbi:uncharacterized protein PGTG_07580 [Puccinia graminis f. sp. tritici CRL 75-36-700-3]|uniref:Uncharacterized protein n=1 Tax=Puccinia graminis f. sp. tritici (strain CRL 75-36-700-3 / race SCCL) TaxID=418459 RepID=E3KCN1_PUCGT|nr:uncharacterized protein PGTG_07580 [Puccinia graminis f. sp. tritici CRL 75-36-700-3]EFP82183.2 hypothetical protein PGTG_07580 [Puccinia graminis f. sp. tritici CRL 75-36-700-3]
MAHANFLCNDKGTIRNRKATLGHCLRLVNDADLKSRSGPFLKKENAKWLMTLAPPGKKRGFTCEHVKIDGFPITREFCCRPKTKDPLVFGNIGTGTEERARALISRSTKGMQTAFAPTYVPGKLSSIPITTTDSPPKFPGIFIHKYFPFSYKPL